MHPCERCKHHATVHVEGEVYHACKVDLFEKKKVTFNPSTCPFFSPS